MQFPKIILKKNREQSLLRFHPWVFSGAIERKDSGLGDGDIVEVYSISNQYLGTGFYQDGTITVRILSFEKRDIDQSFWNEKIANAFQKRKALNVLNSQTNAARIVFGEGDELPALIIDYYNGHVVMQAYSIGMHNCREQISIALQNAIGQELKLIYDKSSEVLSKRKFESQNQYLFGSPSNSPVVIHEHGNKFLVNWETGQKTGFFIDQRENRKLLAYYSKGKKVLNTFCYSGGFSIYAMNKGADEVHSVDISEKAIELTRENITLNGHDNNKHLSFAADVFDFIRDRNDYYDVIVLDPPAFAKHKDAKHNAVIGYKRINAEAITRIKSGGVLFTFSCSQVVSKELFNSTILAAAIEAKRKVKILHQLSQPSDHPINIFHPEGEYLKGLVLLVE